MKSLKVSILIPSYNASKWIGQAVESALEQSWPNKEVIVIDDGSSDNSLEILRSFGDRIQLKARENLGGNKTRNELLEMAQGDWVQFLDADDFLLPHKVENQLSVLEESPDARLIYGPLLVEHHALDGSVRTADWIPHNQNGNHDPWAYHLGWKLSQTGGVLIHRESLVHAGGWNEDQPCCQDNELFFRMLKAGYAFKHSLHQDAVYRRFPEGSVSTSKSSLVIKEILKLLDEGEAFLEKQGELSERRRQAANQNRLALARSIWPHNHRSAMAIRERIRRSDPHFKPEAEAHAPALYRIAFRLLGFRGAERISYMKRKIIRS